MNNSADFQQGLVVDLALKGLPQKGTQYYPRIYNDEGIFLHFFIDFKSPTKRISIGTFNEGVVVHYLTPLVVTAIERVSDSVYKVFCDISKAVHGFTVNGLVSTDIAFQNGARIPPFSVLAHVAGLTSYLKLPLITEYTELPKPARIRETISVTSAGYMSTAAYDKARIPVISAIDAINISYWSVYNG